MEVNNVVNSYAATTPVETIQQQNPAPKQEGAAVEQTKNVETSAENQTTGKGTAVDTKA